MTSENLEALIASLREDLEGIDNDIKGYKEELIAGLDGDFSGSNAGVGSLHKILALVDSVARKRCLGTCLRRIHFFND